jgi:signal transduction histidine kinase
MSSDSRTGEAVGSVEEEVAGAMTRGLHRTTQPLTVIQGILELALLNASTVDEYKHAIEQSLEELQRVVDCFEQLRALTPAHL